MNEGFDQMAELIFLIDPELKTKAEVRAASNNKTCTKDSELLSRVELLTTAVAMLARVYDENEIQKRIINQRVRGTSGDSSSKPTVALSQKFLFPSLTDTSEESDDEIPTESRSERKRRREQKRRNDVNQGLDQLMEVIFIIDPQLKVKAMERANSECGKGRALKTESNLLCRVELIKNSVATLARIHQDSEAHRSIIAHGLVRQPSMEDQQEDERGFASFEGGARSAFEPPDSDRKPAAKRQKY